MNAAKGTCMIPALLTEVQKSPIVHTIPLDTPLRLREDFPMCDIIDGPHCTFPSLGDLQLFFKAVKLCH